MSWLFCCPFVCQSARVTLKIYSIDDWLIFYCLKMTLCQFYTVNYDLVISKICFLLRLICSVLGASKLSVLKKSTCNCVGLLHHHFGFNLIWHYRSMWFLRHKLCSTYNKFIFIFLEGFYVNPQEVSMTWTHRQVKQYLSVSWWYI